MAILVLKHEEPGEDTLCKKYDTFYDFATTFPIELSPVGVVSIGSWVCPHTYNMKEYTSQEALGDVIKTQPFLSYLRSRWYTVYTIKDQII